jgi:hypothetical protein
MDVSAGMDGAMVKKTVKKAVKKTVKKSRRINRVRSVRVMISLPPGLLETLDEAAAKDATTRSGLIRMALIWYLRPQGRELDQTDPEQIEQVLRVRRLSRALNTLKKDLDAQE